MGLLLLGWNELSNEPAPTSYSEKRSRAARRKMEFDEYDATGRKMPLAVTESGAAICLVLQPYEAMK